jgi:hypothetical protein
MCDTEKTLVFNDTIDEPVDRSVYELECCMISRTGVYFWEGRSSDSYKGSIQDHKTECVDFIVKERLGSWLKEETESKVSRKHFLF